MADAEKVTVLRNGEEVILNMSKGGLMENLLKDKEGFATYRIPAVVYLTMEGSAAQRAGLIPPGDSIVGVNGIITPVFGDLRSALDSNRNQQVTLDYYRNGVLYTTTAGGVDSAGTLGFYAMSAPQIYRTVTLKYSFF